MSSVKKAVAGIAVLGAVVGMVAFAPAASAENYAPELASRNVDAGARQTLTITGAQAGCRVSYSIVDRTGDLVRGPRRTGVDASGQASSRLKMPTEPGVYFIVTRVDNFPGQSGCTPSKSRVRIVVS